MTQILSKRDYDEAQKRAFNRARQTPLVREQLRALIIGEDLIADIVDIAQKLNRGTEKTVNSEGGYQDVVMGRDRAGSLKAAAEVKLALLRKVLPDLKAVELTGAEGGPITTQSEVNPVELLTRLQTFRDGAMGEPDPRLQSDDGLGPGGVHQSAEQERAAGPDAVRDDGGPEAVVVHGWSPEGGFL